MFFLVCALLAMSCFDSARSSLCKNLLHSQLGHSPECCHIHCIILVFLFHIARNWYFCESTRSLSRWPCETGRKLKRGGFKRGYGKKNVFICFYFEFLDDDHVSYDISMICVDGDHFVLIEIDIFEYSCFWSDYNNVSKASGYAHGIHRCF